MVYARHNGELLGKRFGTLNGVGFGLDEFPDTEIRSGHAHGITADVQTALIPGRCFSKMKMQKNLGMKKRHREGERERR